MPVKKRARVLRPSVDWLDDRCLLSGLGSNTGLTPAQITQAYGLNAIQLKDGTQTVAGTGAGETIAIIDAYHDPDLASDLNVFDSTYDLPAASLTQLNENGGAAGGASDDGWAGEETLDVEWAHAIAPGAAIVVVEAASDSQSDLMTAVTTARSLPGVVAISMSWGGSESASQLTYDSLFTTPGGHTGITFVAASGDQGAAGGAEWPASSPNVLAVGGTSLTLGAGNTIAGETTWSGSSGGYSQYEAEPTWQESVQQTGRRSTPDVSFDADPNTGVEVYTTDPSDGQGSWQVVGGTSVGAPAWAAILAIADQGRADAGLTSLDGATQTLPALYSFASTDYNSTASTTSSGAADPTSGVPGGGRLFGGFGGFGFFRGLFGGESGVAASLGSPNGTSLIADLVSYTGATTTTTTTGGGTTTTGGGTSTGGGTTTTGGGTTTTTTPPTQGFPGLPPIWVIITTPTGGGTTTTTGGTTTTTGTHTPTHGTNHVTHTPKHVTSTTGSRTTTHVVAKHVAAVATHKAKAAAVATTTSHPVEVVAVSPVSAPVGLSAAFQNRRPARRRRDDPAQRPDPRRRPVAGPLRHGPLLRRLRRRPPRVGGRRRRVLSRSARGCPMPDARWSVLDENRASGIGHFRRQGRRNRHAPNRRNGRGDSPSTIGGRPIDKNRDVEGFRPGPKGAARASRLDHPRARKEPDP